MLRQTSARRTCPLNARMTESAALSATNRSREAKDTVLVSNLSSEFKVIVHALTIVVRPIHANAVEVAAVIAASKSAGMIVAIRGVLVYTQMEEVGIVRMWLGCSFVLATPLVKILSYF